MREQSLYAGHAPAHALHSSHITESAIMVDSDDDNATGLIFVLSSNHESAVWGLDGGGKAGLL